MDKTFTGIEVNNIARETVYHLIGEGDFDAVRGVAKLMVNLGLGELKIGDGKAEKAEGQVPDLFESADETEGVNAIIGLQALVGIEEPRVRALAEWRKMKQDEREETLDIWEGFQAPV